MVLLSSICQIAPNRLERIFTPAAPEHFRSCLPWVPPLPRPQGFGALRYLGSK